MTRSNTPIRLGIDLGSTLFRVAYVHPEDDQALVTVPISIEDFRPCFPIAERLPSNELYVSRYFPSLIQRLDHEFDLDFGERRRGTQDVLAELVTRAVESAREYTACDVAGIVLSGPMWLTTESRAAIRAAAAATHIAQIEVCTDAQALAAWTHTEPSLAGSGGTMLFLVAGYTGVGIAVARATPRGVRILGRGGQQGVLAGNSLDFTIMQSAYQVLRQERVVTAEAAKSVSPWSELQVAVELAKETAVEGRDADLRFPVELAKDAGRYKLRVSAAALGRVVDAEIAKAIALVAEVLDDAGVQPPEVRHILLIGGTTHIPLVRERLATHFSQATVRHVPSEAIAFGAARLAQQATPDLADTAVDAATEFFYPEIHAEPGLVFVAAERPADTAPPPAASNNASASVAAPPATPSDPATDELSRTPTPQVVNPPIEDVSIAALLRASALTAPSAVVQRLRQLELAAARERARLELAMKSAPTTHN
jgi:hypothetical protein